MEFSGTLWLTGFCMMSIDLYASYAEEKQLRYDQFYALGSGEKQFVVHHHGSEISLESYLCQSHTKEAQIESRVHSRTCVEERKGRNRDCLE